MNFMFRSSLRKSLIVTAGLQHKLIIFPNMCRPITIKIVPPKNKHCGAPKENHDERNMRLGRPMSPHLSIYKAQMSSMLSLSHRTTGIWLMVYVWVLAFGSHVFDLPHFIEFLHTVNFPAVFIIIMKFILSYPLSYHLSNGLRHFLWDMASMLEINQVYNTGYLMLAMSVLGSAFCAML